MKPPHTGFCFFFAFFSTNPSSNRHVSHRVEISSTPRRAGVLRREFRVHLFSCSIVCTLLFLSGTHAHTPARSVTQQANLFNMRGRATARRDAPDHHVDGEDPFSFPARSRSQSPSRAAVPNAIQDRDSLRALFECTGGGSWRTSLGWPSWDCVRRTSRNPFGEAGDTTKRRAQTAMAAAAAAGATGAGTGCSTPTRTSGGGSPSNPFAPKEVHNGNPFAPMTATTQASPSTTTAAPVSAAASARRATEMLVLPHVGSTSPTGTPTAMRRATGHLPSPPSPTSPASRGASPLAAAANARKVRGRHRSPSPPADTQTCPTLLDQPRPRGSSSLEAGSRYRSPSPPAGGQRRSALLGPPRQRVSIEAGAAWFGVSLGAAGRVTDLKLVDNGLVGTLPSALGGLDMLRYLHLGRNALSGGVSPIGLNTLYA